MTRTVARIIIVNYEDMTVQQQDEIVSKIDAPVREIAHCAEFFPLGIFPALFVLSYNPIKKNKIKLLFICALICILYAVSDEIHQIFVEGRAFEWLDIGIDSLGGAIGICAAVIITNLRKNRINKKLNLQSY